MKGVNSKQSPFMENLHSLFNECDTDKNGSLTRDEFCKLCTKIGLDSAAAAKTFDRLDVNKDERITFDEFAAGFNKYQQNSQQNNNTNQQQSINNQTAATNSHRLSPSNALSRKSASPLGVISTGETSQQQHLVLSGNNSHSPRRLSPSTFSNHSSISYQNNEHDAPLTSITSNGNFSQFNDESNQYSVNSNNSINNNFKVYSNDDDYYYNDNQTGSQFSSLSNAPSLNGQRSIQDLLECVQKLQEENQLMAQVMLKDRKEREEYISQLGEEFDSQVKQVEERYNKRTKDEIEIERRKYKQMIQSELDKLQSHYSTLESMANVIKSKSANSNRLNTEINDLNENVKYKLESTYKENKKLERSLKDTKSEVAQIREEMQRLKCQYEEKLRTAHAKNNETLNQCDDIKQQLSIVKDSNKKLQDTSDAITSYINETVDPVLQKTTDDGLLMASLTSRSYNDNSVDDQSRRGSILSDYLLPQQQQDDDEDKESNLKLNNKEKKNETYKTSSSGSSSNDRQKQTTTTDAAAIKATNQTKSDAIVEQNTNVNQKQTTDLRNKHSLTNVDSRHETKVERLVDANAQVDVKNKALKEPQAAIANEETNTNVESIDCPIVEQADGEVVARFHVILVGDSFVGKSSFASRFMGGAFKQGLISNCSIDFSAKDYKVDGVNYGIDLWDTAGQERFRSITASYFRKADGIILMYDVSEKRSYLNVRNWMSTIAESASENVAVLLVGNKIDLRTADNMSKCVPECEGHRLAKEYDILFLETSVKTGQNLLASIGRLIRLIAERKAPASVDDSDTIKLNSKTRGFACMPKNC